MLRIVALDEVKEALRALRRLDGVHALAQVLLPVQGDECAHTELLLAEEFDALLRGVRVSHDNVIKRTARSRDGHVKLGRDATESSEAANDARDGSLGLGLHERIELAGARG